MLYWHKHRDGWKTPVPMEEDTLLDTDMLMSEFSDTLFSTLSSHPPVAWPNPREIGNPPQGWLLLAVWGPHRVHGAPAREQWGVWSERTSHF